MFKIRITSYLVLIVFILCNSSATAKTKSVEIHLIQLVAQKTVDKEGDLLYFSITEYPTEGEAKLTRIPMFPLHWLSKELPTLKDVTMWSGEITDENSVLVIFSLLAQTIPLLESDNLIGEMQVEITNKNNNIKMQWGVPQYVDEPDVRQQKTNTSKYMLLGNASIYTVEFTVAVH